tara:strand:+ start:609 stop:1235 length:627 start_codon:yes stop_codon:yes gene_type:complete
MGNGIPPKPPSMKKQDEDKFIGPPEPPFDVKGTGYDYRTAESNKMKADKTGHWASRVPSGKDEGLILKGRGHETYDKTVSTEKDMGYEIYEKDGRDYSKATPRRAKFEEIIYNAPDELAQVVTRQDGRTHHALYTFLDKDDVRKYVSSNTDQWWKPKELSHQGALYKNASNQVKSGNFLSETDAWGLYKELTHTSVQKRFVDSIMGKN